MHYPRISKDSQGVALIPIMKSSRIVTLFSDQPGSTWRPSSVPLSILLHAVVLALLIFALSHTPHTVEGPPADRYTVRLMNLERPDPQPRRASGGGLGSPSRGGTAGHGGARKPSSAANGSGGPSGMPAPGAPAEQHVETAKAATPGDESQGAAVAQPMALQPARLTPLHRTLLQPDVPPNLPRLKENPLPRILMWSADTSSLRKIVPAPPQVVQAWTNTKPVLTAPNHEPKLADVRIASSPFATRLPSLPPSTTTPLVVSHPEPAKQQPQTASKSTSKPTPARVISLSDLQVQTGTVALPLINEVAPAPNTSLMSGLSKSTAALATNATGSAGGSQNGSAAKSGTQVASGTSSGGRSTGTGSGGSGSTGGGTSGTAAKAGNNQSGNGQNGSGQNGGGQPGKGGAGQTGNGTGTGAIASAGSGGSGGAGTAGNSGSGNGGGGTGGSGGGPTGGGGNGGGGTGNDLLGGVGSGGDQGFDRVNLPKDGTFGVVVAGSQSLTEQYPEIAGVWIGRLAYTVYLHVGLQKSWILQYSLPRTAEAIPGRNSVRPDAPWPYTIVRPHLAPGDLNADAVLVHGFVNANGRFEQLKVVFPEEFTQTKFILASLQQWQFRPAKQNGQIAAVEVLLIIPDQQE
jgi:hypothetical protein